MSADHPIAIALPLNIDAFTGIAQGATNTMFLQQFAGLLGPDGRATATLAPPRQPATALVGLRFSFAAIGIPVRSRSHHRCPD